MGEFVSNQSSAQSAEVPRPGMFATVRNRRGVIAGVEPFDGDNGRLHLVQIDYKDEQSPAAERLIWELEQPFAHLLEPNALPDPARSQPMPAEDFDALLRAVRWTSAMPFLDPDGSGPLERLSFRSPFHSAVEVEDYQLVPLLKALRMPRVNLLIADDVGIGKTVEAGLILSELLIRRRVQRVLILTPASLRLQWRDEMWDKFSLAFDLVDRAETNALRRRLGMDANPWRAYPRIIASYHYLRQSDVLEHFTTACRAPEGSPHLPWDLLIVDECHNLMPSPFGDDSDLTKMLRLIAPYFEHRLFLSATPHNGHTRSFSGLLELLDPVRFSATDELKPAERARIQQVVIRRLKREINARTNPPKFCTRVPPEGLRLSLSDAELELARARGRRTAALDATAAGVYGLELGDHGLLCGCDASVGFEGRLLDPKGFWRVDKDKDPELRHTVLTLVAFHDLEEKIRACGGDREAGIEAFLSQNGGEGWMLPETLRFADYGLGHDERAKHPQPVASRLGARFYDWQLAQSGEESWRECHLHARNLLGEQGYRELLEEVAARERGEEPERDSRQVWVGDASRSLDKERQARLW